MGQASDDDLVWDEEGESAPSPTHPAKSWKILIVDDEPDIHTITRLALDGIEFKQMGLEFLSAHSAREAILQLAAHPDISLIFLDVVMEAEDSGLRLVRHIREEMGNLMVRIVLRTGQPGQAPERRVIHDYDINDYKTKTELSSEKLYTITIAALRSYSDLKMIELSRKGLSKIIDASRGLFHLQSFETFTAGVLEQLTGLLALEEDSLYCSNQTLVSSSKGEQLVIRAATGAFARLGNQPVDKALPKPVVSLLREALSRRGNVFGDGQHVIYIDGGGSTDNLIYLEKIGDLKKLDKDLLELFGANLAVAFDNIRLNGEISRTQREIVHTLGEVGETRSQETGYHVKRVAEYARLIAQKLGLPEPEVELIKEASPLHDIGKIAIPDRILNKPGKHEPGEWEIMKTHARLGYEMLCHSDTEILKAAAVIALTHHEKWDGSGYPGGLKGQDIPVSGRISALADVFDALGSARCYKPAWQMDEILGYLKAAQGTHFDPVLIDLLFENLEEFLTIRTRYRDPGT